MVLAPVFTFKVMVFALCMYVSVHKGAPCMSLTVERGRADVTPGLLFWR